MFAGVPPAAFAAPLVQAGLLSQLSLILGVPASALAFLTATPFEPQGADASSQRALAGSTGGALVAVGLSPVAASVSTVLAAAGLTDAALAAAVQAVMASSMAALAGGLASVAGMLTALGIPSAAALTAALTLSQLYPITAAVVSATSSASPSPVPMRVVSAAEQAAASAASLRATAIIVGGVLGGLCLLVCSAFYYFGAAGRTVRGARRVKPLGAGDAAAPPAGAAAALQEEGMNDFMRSELRLVVQKFAVETEVRGTTLKARERRVRRGVAEHMAATRKLVDFDGPKHDLLAFREGGL